MDSVDVVRRLHQHRNWVNQRLRYTARKLTPDQLHRPFEIGQGTIWLTLTHLYAAEYVWLAALCGDEKPLAPGDELGMLPGNQQGPGALKDTEELEKAWTTLDRRWSDYLANLTTESLEGVAYKWSSLSNERFGTRRIDILLHICTHAQYTTAQVVNMMRHVGVTSAIHLFT